MPHRSQTSTTRYAQDVVDGSVLACEWVVRACERHLDDLGRDFAYIFDDKRALRAVRFIELLPHTKGKWASKGQKLTLEPWQQFVVGSLFGWVHKETGLRRFRECYLEIPRKNGKSSLAAAVGLYCLLEDGEYGAEVYSGATSEKQAWEVFRPARLMAQKAEELANHYGLEVNAKNLLRLEDFARFEPVIGNPGDGSSPHCAIVDEFHEHRTPDLFDTMITGMGAREQPLMFVITTAGSNMGGPCYEKRLESQKILSGVFDDDRFFSVIYSLDDGDDWTDPKMWAKANPNLGVSVSEEYLESQVASALRSPSKQSAVKTKHFNLWTGAREAFVNMNQWRSAADELLKPDDFAGEAAYIGLDLATRVDVAACLLLFVRHIDGFRHYYALPQLFIPEAAMTESKNAKTYAGWVSSGHLEVMGLEEIDFGGVEERIRSLCDTFAVKEVAYDPWQATQLSQALRKERVTAVEYRNTVGNMSPPMRELEGSLASGRFHHPDNPAFNWMASNLVAREDAKENVYPRKEAPENKIDGMVALLMAMGRAMHEAPAKKAKVLFL